MQFNPLRTVKVQYFIQNKFHVNCHIKHVYLSPGFCPLFVKIEHIIVHALYYIIKNNLILDTGDFYPIQKVPIVKELSVWITICSVLVSPLSSYSLLPWSNGFFHVIWPCVFINTLNFLLLIAVTVMLTIIAGKYFKRAWSNFAKRLEMVLPDIT